MSNMRKLFLILACLIVLFVGIGVFVVATRKTEATVELLGSEKVVGQSFRFEIGGGSTVEVSAPFPDGKEIILQGKRTDGGILVSQRDNSGAWIKLGECGYFGFILSNRYRMRISLAGLAPPNAFDCKQLEASF